MLAYYIHDLSPFVLRFSENYGVRWYGLAYVAAFFIGILIVRRLSQLGYCDIPAQKVSDFIIGGAIFGVLLGGRLGYMLFYDLENFLRNPLIFFRVMDGGMSAHGGILGLTLYTLWYSFRHKVSWRNIGDNLVVAAPLGLFLGRVANFINGTLRACRQRAVGRAVSKGTLRGAAGDGATCPQRSRHHQSRMDRRRRRD